VADVFISYASEDRDAARRLAEHLEQSGCSVWWDRRLIPGSDYSRRIETELEAASCVVVLWSKASVDSDWVSIEAGYAREQRKLMPALIEDVADEVPLEFRRLHSARLVGWNGVAEDPELQSLVSAVNAATGVEATPRPSSQQGVESARQVYDRGKAAHSRRDFDESVRLFELALERGLPDEMLANGHVSLGNSLIELGRLDEARAAHERGLEIDPDNHQAWVGLGIIHRLQGDLDEAERCYQKAIRLAPDYAELHASLGALFCFREQPERAIEALDRAISLSPGLPVAHANLAIAQAMLGNFEEAESSLTHAVTLGYHNEANARARINELKRAAARS
jgi:tetratricopeptide (TPR) repeat protein